MKNEANGLTITYGEKSVLELKQLLEHRHLNLEPGFQRKSVWSELDRRKLIQSILQGYPLPSIFLYRRQDENHITYDVVDGKQRLETIFMFCGAKGYGNRRFEVKLLDDDGTPEWVSWGALLRRHEGPRIDGFEIQTVEVGGDLAQIIDLFVRINSTGKALKGAEKRHAKFYSSPVLAEANRLAARWRVWLAAQRVISKAQSDRMKDVELMSELLVSTLGGGLIDQKLAVDKAVGNAGYRGPALAKASREVHATLLSVKRMFPRIGETRLSNSSEFYSLAMLVHDLRKRKLILTDARRNRAAWHLLTRLDQGVAEVRERQRSAKGTGPGQQLFVDYLISVQQGTDKLFQRQKRDKILGALLAGIFEAKDEKRLFSKEQRRILWHSEDRKVCADPNCRRPLTWATFQVDHVEPHSRGGKTSLKNAQLLCGECNARKGNKRR